MKDITSKLDSAAQAFQARLYPWGESIMCRRHEPFGDSIDARHHCLACGFAESTNQISGFFSRELASARGDVNDVMTDLILKCYLLIERFYMVFDILKLPTEYRIRHFGVFRKIYRWATFIKYPKAFLLVHRPCYFVENVAGFDASGFDEIIHQSFVDEFYSGADGNRRLFERLGGKSRVAVLFPDPEILIPDFCAAAHKFVELINDNTVYMEILDSMTIYESYFSALDHPPATA